MTLSDTDWEDLLDAIDSKQCTPFIGPEVCAPHLPTDKDIAKKWAEKYNYPMDDSSQLSRVAQFLNIQKLRPKFRIQKEMESQEIPNFASAEYKDTPYDILARLNLPIYITTNYDLFMEKSLKDIGKEPASEYCVWNDELKDYVKKLDCPLAFNKTYKPTVTNPLVYHLNGSIDLPDSIVLTEKDYFDFLIYLSKESDQVLPSVIRTDLAKNTYLFIGYRLEDTNFLAMFISITNFVKRLGGEDEGRSIAVQFTSIINQDKKELIQEYLNKYTDDLFNISTYSDGPYQFAKDLSQRWEKYKSV